MKQILQSDVIELGHIGFKEAYALIKMPFADWLAVCRSYDWQIDACEDIRGYTVARNNLGHKMSTISMTNKALFFSRKPVR